VCYWKKNHDTSKTEKIIMSFNLVETNIFETIEGAEQFVQTFGKYGLLKSCEYGIMHEILEAEIKSAHKTYESYDSSKRYNHSIFHNEKKDVELKTYRTYLHPMVTGAEIGNLDYFKKNFTLKENVLAKSISSAIYGGHLIIVKYLIDNNKEKITQFKEPSAILLAIRGNQVEILDLLITEGIELPVEFLAQTLHNNSIDVFKYLINKIEKKIIDLPEYSSDSWLNRLLSSEKNDTVKLAIKHGYISK